MNFGNADFSQYEGKTELELSQMKYDKLLDGFLKVIDLYADASLKVKAGEMTADQAIDALDAELRPIAMMLLMLDTLRGENSFANRAEREMAKKADSDEELIAKFREQLGDL
jgi:hypothetical protein